jgi:hypothetical protein
MRDAAEWVMGELKTLPITVGLSWSRKSPPGMDEIEKAAHRTGRFAKEDPEYYGALGEFLGWISKGTERATPPTIS